MPSVEDSETLCERARQALADVQDPEMGESLADLGVIDRVELDGRVLRITLIPTSATCPMADVMLDDAEAAVQRVCPAGISAEAVMDWDTEWTPQRMAPALRERFGW